MQSLKLTNLGIVLCACCTFVLLLGLDFPQGEVLLAPEISVSESVLDMIIKAQMTRQKLIGFLGSPTVESDSLEKNSVLLRYLPPHKMLNGDKELGFEIVVTDGHAVRWSAIDSEMNKPK